MCKKFKQTINQLKKTDSLFESLISRESDTDIEELTIKTDNANSVCLIEGGNCNCGGKAFQFYYELLNRGYRTIIFFVPEDCNEQVTKGAKLICNLDKFCDENFDIINISNIESDPTTNIINDKEISLNHFSNHSSDGKAK